MAGLMRPLADRLMAAQSFAMGRGRQGRDRGGHEQAREQKAAHQPSSFDQLMA